MFQSRPSSSAATLDHKELLSENRCAEPAPEIAPIPREEYFHAKYQRERVLGILLLIPISPLIAACWVAVRLTSSGPALYRQTRVGYRGKEFQVLKLRTMRLDAEANGPQWSSHHDPRVTLIGRVFRKLHLDELPQLINVVRGEMVLTGPRPERPEFVKLLTAEIPNYEHRLLVKPGITGLAQVNLPPDSDLRSVKNKQILDMHYVEHSSFWYDQKLLACTALKVLLIKNAKLNQLLGVNGQHLLQHASASGGENSHGSTKLSDLMREANPSDPWNDGDKEETDNDEARMKPNLRRPR